MKNRLYKIIASYKFIDNKFRSQFNLEFTRIVQSTSKFKALKKFIDLLEKELKNDKSILKEHHINTIVIKELCDSHEIINAG